MDWQHFTDVILAGVIIITCIVFIAYGHDGAIKAVLGTAVAWLFGKAGFNYVQSKISGKNGGQDVE